LIRLVLRNQDLHLGIEDLQHVEGTNRAVDFLVVDPNDFRYALSRIDSLVADRESHEVTSVVRWSTAWPSLASNSRATVGEVQEFPFNNNLLTCSSAVSPSANHVT
jgi:hypothetical protein